jgi:uncharacterized protein (TIGR02646 family)
VRFIHRDPSRVPADWLVEAVKAAVDVDAVGEADRGKAIDERDHVWQTAKRWLSDMSSEKCWYCESRQERSDNAVDHYRPKAGVYERSDHPGYWWLAFDWQNYRFCCTFCNSRRHSRHGTSGGKRTHFPIRDETLRVFDPNGNLADEQALLLDPAVVGDPEHLWFQLDGTLAPSAHVGAPGSYPWERAEASIHVYHLDEPTLCERRKQLRRLIEDEVRNAQDGVALYADGDERGHRIVSQALTRIREWSGPDSELSAVVRCALLELQVEFPFALRALEVCVGQ